MKRMIMAVLAALCACGHMTTPTPATAGVAVVKNESFDLMRVYLVFGTSSTPIRLGTVEAQQRGTFHFALQSGVDYRFLYAPLAKDGTYITEAITLQPGDTVELHIANYLPFSSIWLRR